MSDKAQTKLKRGSLFGVVMVAAYNFLSASKEVASGMVVQNINPIVLTFVIFLIVFLFFQLASLIQGNEAYHAPLKDRKSLLLLNVFSCGAWVGFFYSVRYLEPAIVSAIMAGLGPALATILLPFWYKNITLSRTDIIGSLGVFVSTVFIVYVLLSGNSSLGIVSKSDFLQGAISTFIGSIAMVGASISSKKLSDRGCRPTAIMAHRFYLLIAFCAFISLFMDVNLQELSTFSLWIVLMTLFGVIIPLWALQIGIKYLDPLLVMLLIATAPAFTYVIQFFDLRLKPNPVVFAGIAMLCFFATISQIYPAFLKIWKKDI